MIISLLFLTSYSFGELGLNTNLERPSGYKWEGNLCVDSSQNTIKNFEEAIEKCPPVRDDSLIKERYAQLNKPAKCDKNIVSERNLFFKEMIERDRQLEPSWYDYKFSDLNIFVLDSDSSQCVSFYDPNKGWQHLRVNSGYEAPEDDYFSLPTFMYMDENHRKLANELASIMRDNGLRNAYVWHWGARNDDEVASDSELAFYRSYISRSDTPDENSMAIGVASHEAFHFLYQGGRNRNWPRDPTQISDPNAIICYAGNEDIKRLHREEMKALGEAFIANNLEEKRSKARDFISLRNQRYAHTPQVTRNYSQRASHCKVEEANSEIHEGTAQYIEDALQLDLGITSRKQLNNASMFHLEFLIESDWVEDENRPIRSFYEAGSFMLHLIKDLYDGDFINLTKKISNAQTNQDGNGVFYYKILEQILDGKEPTFN